MERGGSDSPGMLLRQQSVTQQRLAQAQALVEELRRQAEAEGEGELEHEQQQRQASRGTPARPEPTQLAIRQEQEQEQEEGQAQGRGRGHWGAVRAHVNMRQATRAFRVPPPPAGPPPKFALSSNDLDP